MSQLVQSGGRFSPACTHCAVYSIIFGVLHSNEPEWNAAMIEPTSDINDQLKFKWQHASNVEHGNILYHLIFTEPSEALKKEVRTRKNPSGLFMKRSELKAIIKYAHSQTGLFMKSSKPLKRTIPDICSARKLFLNITRGTTDPWVDTITGGTL